MSKPALFNVPKSFLPPGSVRKINLATGTRMWLINGQWFHTKRQYFLAVQNAQEAARASSLLQQDGDTRAVAKTGAATDHLRTQLPITEPIIDTSEKTND